MRCDSDCRARMVNVQCTMINVRGFTARFHTEIKVLELHPFRSERAQDTFLRLWEQYDTHLNRKISTGITSQIALLAHSGGREQQKADDDRAHHRRGERPPACWYPPPAWGQQPLPL